MSDAPTAQKSLLAKLTLYIVVIQPINFIAGIVIGTRFNDSPASQAQCNPVNHLAILVIVIGAVSGLMALAGLVQAIAHKNGHDIKKGILLLVMCYFVGLISLGAADFIGIGCGATPF